MSKAAVRFTKLDNWGILVSLICAIHCAATPLLLVLSAYLSVRADLIESLELPFLILSATLGVLAMKQAYSKHNRVLPALMIFAGLMLFLIGGWVQGEIFEILWRVTGSILIVGGHVCNKRFLKLVYHES